jgi:uncharacterized membrane protein YtjA (UPF0391 family)
MVSSYKFVDHSGVLMTFNVWRQVVINWAVTLLIVAIVAGLLGFSGIAGAATQIAWILFVVGLIAAVVLFVTGRRGAV